MRSLPWAIGLGQPSHIQYDYIRAHNMAMEAWNRKHMPNVDSVPKRDNDVPGMPVTVRKYEAKPMTRATDGLRLARPGDLAACVAMINHTHIGRDLFRPYTVEFLEDRLGVGLPDADPEHLRPGYCLRDLWVVEREGQVFEALLADMPSTPETRYLQWRGDTPAIASPVHVDLVYW